MISLFSPIFLLVASYIFRDERLDYYLNDMLGQTARVLAIVDVFGLVIFGLFLIDYHRKETPRTIKKLLWGYMVALLGAGIGFMFNLVLVPQPTPGVYMFDLLATGATVALAGLSVRSFKTR